ncbi:MAG TPA: hypothetical protein DCQ06_06195 [Myxococcales bacterium]|nr:hypothetical protein [Myxococcales bacterium]HAN31172.1 hypothetical protein [Myxococcales bacterium]
MKQTHTSSQAFSSPCRRALTAVTLCALVTGAISCEQTTSRDRLALHELSPGLSYGSVTPRFGKGPAVLTHVLSLDPKRWSLVHVDAKQTKRKLSDAAGFREAANAVAAVNGIYFDPEYRPLGLMVSEGQQKSPLRRVDHGVFTLSARGAEIQHAKAYQAPKDLDFAAECGPRLVVDGKPLEFKPGLARRTAIGFDNEGQIYLVITSGVIGLGNFADFLARPKEQNGLGLHGALNLDGGSSTMFDLQTSARRARVRSAVLVPTGIAVKARRKPSSTK